MHQASLKPSLDYIIGDVMPSVLNSELETLQGQFNGGQSKKRKDNKISLLLPFRYPPQIRFPADRRLKTKRSLPPTTFLHSREHQFRCFYRYRLRCKKGQPGRDQVCINELNGPGFVRQKLPGKRCFASAIWPRSDDDLFHAHSVGQSVVSVEKPNSHFCQLPFFEPWMTRITRMVTRGRPAPLLPLWPVLKQQVLLINQHPLNCYHA